MAFELIRSAFPAIAASNIVDRQIVAIPAGSTERNVYPVATTNVRPHGVALASAVRGAAVTVHDNANYVKCVAAASVGAGAQIGVVGATRSVGPVTGASGSVIWSVGESVTPAAAGEILTVLVNPRQLSGLV